MQLLNQLLEALLDTVGQRFGAAHKLNIHRQLRFESQSLEQAQLNFILHRQARDQA